MKRKWLAAIGLLSLLGIAALWFDAGESDGDIAGSNATAEVNGPAIDVATAPAPEVVQPETGKASPVAEEALRVSIETPVFGGEVRDGNGAPVEGATISWTGLPEASIDPEVGWTGLDLARLRQGTLWSESDAEGVFEYGAAPEATTGTTVLWVTHPEYGAVHLIVPGSADRGENSRITLEPAPARTATVLREKREVAGAVVLQFAVPEDGTTDEERRARSAFFREMLTGASGTVALTSFGGREGLLAEHGELSSESLTRPCTGDVRLELVPALRAEGSVILRDGADMPDQVRVHGDLAVGDGWVRQASVPVRLDATWGPLSIAARTGRRLRLTVEGGGVVRESIEADAPVGSNLHLDIETVLGVDQWFVAMDAHTGDPIVEARLEVHWQEDTGNWTVLEERPRDDGYFFVRGCRPGTIFYIARAPGYAFARGGPELIPAAEPYTLEVMLRPAGRVEGRCTLNGEPVRSFKVMYWPRDRVQQLWNETYEDREDGSFVIEEVAAGDLTLVAHGPDLGQSAAVTIEVPAGEAGQVGLEVTRARIGRGTAVDQVTGEPVRGAQVQVFVTHGAQPIYQTGSVVTTDGKGRFEISGLSDIPTTYEITAPGYSLAILTTRPGSSRSLDLGRIELTRTQPLEIRLHHPPGADPTQYQVRTHNMGLLATAFDGNGLVLVEDFFAAPHLFLVDLPNGNTTYHSVELLPGHDWVIDLHLDGTCRLNVEVEAAAGEALPYPLWAIVKYPDGPTFIDWEAAVPESGTVHLEHLPPGPVDVALVAGEDTLANEPFELLPGEERTLQLSVAQETRHFRVVDEGGRPLPSTEVRFSIDGSEDRRLGGRTDSNGELRCAGLTPGALSAHLIHPTAGMVVDVPVRLDSDADDAIEIPFVADQSWSAILLDDERPAAGVVCRLTNRATILAVGAAVPSDSAGRVRWDRVGLGSYDLRADHPNYWPVRVSLPSNRGEAEHRIPVRRRGDLVLQITDTGGSALDGVPVQLTSLEFGSGVRDWLEAGLIQASPAHLTTDPNGELELRGLPSGEFRWEVQVSGSEPAMGTATVTGGTRARIHITIP